MSISQVYALEPQSISSQFMDAALDDPRMGQMGDSYHLNVAGWALGHKAPVLSVEIYAGRQRLIAAPISNPRDDIEGIYPKVPWSARTGFSTAISLLGFPGPFEFRVVTVDADNQRTILSTIKGRRKPLPAAPPDAALPLPLLVTTLGRSGSTWFMRLLGNHPDIAAHKPYQGDTRVASYWLGVLSTLGHPSSYLLPLTATGLADPRWWTGTGRVPLPEATDASFATWLGRDHVEGLMAFCRDRIGHTYKQITLAARAEARYVVEKVSPNIVPFLARDLFPDSPEIILVRDFRDMLCSILAFTERNGHHHFGRDGVETDEDYVGLLGRSAEDLLYTWEKRRDQAILVRYEDLVAEPVAVLENVLSHCKLQHSTEALQRMVITGSSTTVEEDKHRTVNDPARSIGRWRRELSPSLLSACEVAFADVLDGFGYK